jgi:hypothetical protein
MSRYILVPIVIALVGLSARGQDPDQIWDKGNESVRRLPPAVFPELPEAVASSLQRRGCTIPQFLNASHPVSVIRGHFISATGNDWAVLCSVRRVSSVLVFRNGGVTAVDALFPVDDRSSLEGNGDGTTVYDRAIEVAAPRVLQEYATRHKWRSPSGGFTHDGIEDGGEKGVVFWYWTGIRWERFIGDDD